jgi:hypothetical protein
MAHKRATGLGAGTGKKKGPASAHLLALSTAAAWRAMDDAPATQAQGTKS